MFGRLDSNKSMTEIDALRLQGNYPHEEKDCSPKCKELGCGKLYVADANWKITCAHCMYTTKKRKKEKTTRGSCHPVTSCHHPTKKQGNAFHLNA